MCSRDADLGEGGEDGRRSLNMREVTGRGTAGSQPGWGDPSMLGPCPDAPLAGAQVSNRQASPPFN